MREEDLFVQFARRRVSKEQAIGDALDRSGAARLLKFDRSETKMRKNEKRKRS